MELYGTLWNHTGRNGIGRDIAGGLSFYNSSRLASSTPRDISPPAFDHDDVLYRLMRRMALPNCGLWLLPFTYDSLSCS